MLRSVACRSGAMELLTHKCVALLVLVCARLCVGLSPLVICSHQDSSNSLWVDLTLALAFSLAGGVLLATVFLHMMSEVRLLMQHFLPDHRLPVTELLVTAGFLLTFLLDEMIINFRSSKVSPTVDEDEPSRPSSSVSDVQVVPRGSLLSLHGLGQGMAVGLADTAASTWLMAAAAGVAGSVDSASTSKRLLGAKSNKTIILFCLVVTFVMATGVVLGTLLWSLEVEGAVLTVLRGIAAGNLLYQAVYELLTREVRQRAMGLLSLFVCLMGYLVILLLQLLDIKSLDKRYSTSSVKPLDPTPQEPEGEPDYEQSYLDDNRN